MPTDNWVDFKAIKAAVNIETVLARYGLLEGLKPSGHNLVGCCPIHKGTNPRAFTVDPKKGAWHCFGNCKGGGNVVDLVAALERVTFREAALLLKAWFLDGAAGPATPGRTEEAAPRAEKQRATEELARKELKPLTFALKLDPVHPFFESRGISPETAEAFGAGLCSRGMMKDRIAIPIRDELGRLVAYCGRAVTPEQIEAEGKYKLPPGFPKMDVVYNLHAIPEGVPVLCVVESYLSAWRLYQAGRPHVVALMGSALSARHEELIRAKLGPDSRLVFGLDDDESGRAGLADCLARFAFSHYVRAADFARYAKKPHLLTDEQLRECFPA